LQPAEELAKRIAKYQALCETLISVMVTGCYWGNQQHAKLWVDCLERIANPAEGGGGLLYLLKLRRYPALLLLYAGGLAAVASANYETLAALLTQPKAKDDRGQEEALCSDVYPMAVIATDAGRLLPGLDRKYTPISDHLFEKLRVHLREYIPRDEEFQTVFDRFEYLLGLVHADINRRQVENGWWGPVGCFRWRGRHVPESEIMHKIGKELEAEGSNWPPLKAGLFGGVLDQAKEAKTKFDGFLSQIHWF